MFQDFSAKGLSAGEQEAAPLSAFEEARELIGRYPNLSDAELARLINLYRELSALEMAFMLSDEKLAPRLDRFAGDHRSKIRTPFRQYAALVVYAVVAVATVAWAITVVT